MKKKIIVLVAIVSLSFAANAFAVAQAFTWLATVGGGDQVVQPITAPNAALTLKPSAGVIIGYSSQTTGQSYSLGTYHTSGTFTYATTSTDTNIYRYPTAGGNGVAQGSIQKGPDAPSTATTQYNWTSVAGVAWTASK